MMGLFAEYDATPGHSQKAVAWEAPAVPHGPGFTDAHNMIRVASCVAAVRLKETAMEHGIDVKIKLLGTPAEKLCVGKPYMDRDGYLEGMDVLLAWHPRGPTTVLGDVWPLAYKSMLFQFKIERATGGHQRRRELPGGPRRCDTDVHQRQLHEGAHLRPDAPGREHKRVHDDRGPVHRRDPRLQPARLLLEDQEAITEMLERCADAATLVSGCSVEKRLITAVRTGLPNKTLTDLMMDNLREIVPPHTHHR